MRVGKFHEENSASFLFLMAYWFFFLKKKGKKNWEKGRLKLWCRDRKTVASFEVVTGGLTYTESVLMLFSVEVNDLLRTA